MGQVAPHQGRELELVLRGVKPIAVVNAAKDPEQYKAVYEESSTRGQIKTHILGEGEVVFSLRTNFHKVREYLALRSGKTKVDSNEEYQRRMGRLFGYSEEDIEAFIKSDIQCDCPDCRGVSFRG